MTILEEQPTESGRQVIARAAAVLQTLEGRPTGLNMSEIARASGLPRTTAQRLVAALAAQQFLTVGGSGRIRLGPALARLAGAAHADVTTVIRPHLDILRQQVNETVHLWVAAEREIVLVDQIVCDHEIRVVTPIGARYPLGCTAAGKAILATLSDAEIARLVDGYLEPHTEQSIRSLDALMADLAVVRSEGVAFDLEEHAQDVCAIGAVLCTGTTDRFALCIAAPTRRFHVNRDRLRQAIARCREHIDADLGP
ncbi:IclR family transcriptional regulator [Telmatospirillum sp.]|uniref:IclR family transcriptional regulator n=1 Tax=Telmatospirillum sp. TaxID=2079197 RepID=UPI00284BC169|nr:IclR family transcriptional regulator [Telmatospirillum sp.]MDR3436359.1 IclR family transcriptional regulator [Telmatospirillum sp.]